ncbi:MAG TPA: hypothetical protein VI703_09225 [Anaerolineales bacterium]|jgi:F0F1-type ATP synthase assembly protein I|nr:hypothetical protein [Anaerolineales bacterium]
MPAKRAAKRTSRRSDDWTTYLPVAGRWAFLGGMIVAIVFGLIPSQTINQNPGAQEWVGYIFMLLGVIAGLFHMHKSDEANFILLTIGLAIFSNSFGSVPGDLAGQTVGSYIVGVFSSLGFFFGVVVVAIVVRNIVDWFTA